MLKTLIDPKGHPVVIPGQRASLKKAEAGSIEQTVTDPDYMIENKNGDVYFIKLIRWDYNLLVLADRNEQWLVVKELEENPDQALILSLLQKGSLTAYP